MTDNVTNPWGGHPAPHTLIHTYALCKSILTGDKKYTRGLVNVHAYILVYILPSSASPLHPSTQPGAKRLREPKEGGLVRGWGQGRGGSPKGTKSIQEQRHHTARHGADREELEEVMREAAHLPSCSCVSHLHNESQP